MRTLFALAVAAALTGVVGLTGAAQADDTADAADQPSVITKFTPENVATALEAYNLSYEQRRHENGSPLIIVQPGPLVHDKGMAVIFYGCDETNACDTVTLYTFFNTGDPLEEDVYHIWNDIFRIRTWTKAFRDTDGDTGFVMNVSAVGGVESMSLDFLTGVFLTEMNAFRNALDGVRDGALTSADLRSAENWTGVFQGTFGAMALTDGDGSALTLKELGAPKNQMVE